MRIQPDPPRSTSVYIVDDDTEVRLGFARLLRSVGMTPIVFDTAENFLGAVRDIDDACILLDVAMPGLSGLQVQERLNRCGIRLPVIIVSACDDETTRSRARALGAGLFLRKPVDDQALLDAIAWVTSARRR